MKIVIDIDRKTYWYVKNGFGTKELGDAFRNGIILPKNHGRLIDADDIRCEDSDFDTFRDYCTMFDEIDNAPTIIDAESEG